jgi:CDP-glucose 4,6-dehydratase
MNREFWQNRRVLVTGHTGFKGTWLTLWLKEMGAAITGYAHEPNATPDLYRLSGVEHGITSVIGDIEDLRKLTMTVEKAQPEVVFHLAAQPLVRDSYKYPAETYAINVMGTVNVLETVRRFGKAKALVNVTTDKCYENKEWVWPYRESDSLGGSDPYSSSKACAELVTDAYRRSFFFREDCTAVATARAGNVIGGGDGSPERLLPSVLAAWDLGLPIELRNPNAVRPWQFVLEPLRGYLDLAQRLFEHGHDYAGAWNFGPRQTDAQPVMSVVKTMASIYGDHGAWQVSTQNHPQESQMLQLDCAKSNAKLGWSPQTTLVESIGEVIAWHRCWKSGADIALFMRGRLADYEAKTTQTT